MTARDESRSQPSGDGFRVKTGSSNTWVRVYPDDEIPFEQFLPYAYHRGGCGKFTRDNAFHVGNDCTCGLAALFGGEPCPCGSCTHHRALTTEAGNPLTPKSPVSESGSGVVCRPTEGET